MFDLDNEGYPDERTIELIGQWRIEDDYEKMLTFLTPIMSGYGRCEKREIDNVWEVVTGGWSGNEEIISAMQSNLAFWGIYWQLSKRGGYYEFKGNHLKRIG